MFPVQVAVHKQDRRLITGEIAYNRRHGFPFERPCRKAAAVTGDDLVFAVGILDRSDQDRAQDAVLADAFLQTIHLLIIQHLVRMIGERMQLVKRDHNRIRLTGRFLIFRNHVALLLSVAS